MPSPQDASPGRACWSPSSRSRRRAGTATTTICPPTCGSSGTRRSPTDPRPYGSRCARTSSTARTGSRCSRPAAWGLRARIPRWPITPRTRSARRSTAATDKRRDVAVHAHGAEGIKRAIRAGVRSIEHASMLDDEAIKLAREHGTWLVMNPYTNQYMIERGAAGGYQPYQLEKARQVLEMKLASLRKAVRAGLKLAYGTDAGVQIHGAERPPACDVRRRWHDAARRHPVGDGGECAVAADGGQDRHAAVGRLGRHDRRARRPAHRRARARGAGVGHEAGCSRDGRAAASSKPCAPDAGARRRAVRCAGSRPRACARHGCRSAAAPPACADGAPAGRAAAGRAPALSPCLRRAGRAG